MISKRWLVTFIMIIVGLAAVHPLYAQEEPPPTPDPTMAALEEQIASQNEEISDLSGQVDDLQRDLELAKRELNSLFTVRMAIIAGIVAVATFVGISSLQDVRRTIEAQLQSTMQEADYVQQDTIEKADIIRQDTIERASDEAKRILSDLEGIRERTNKLEDDIPQRINTTISEQLYMLDPSVIAIYVEEGRTEQAQEDMERVYNRLILSGFRNVNWFANPNRLNQHGITILRVTNAEEEAAFNSLLEAGDFDPHKAAFVLYAPFVPPGYRIQDLYAYENMAVANMVSTVVNAILAVGRGLSK